MHSPRCFPPRSTRSFSCLFFSDADKLRGLIRHDLGGERLWRKALVALSAEPDAEEYTEDDVIRVFKGTPPWEGRTASHAERDRLCLAWYKARRY